MNVDIIPLLIGVGGNVLIGTMAIIMVAKLNRRIAELQDALKQERDLRMYWHLVAKGKVDK